MAEWHGDKNLQVSRAHSWDFMARFTPLCDFTRGGGVNPLVNKMEWGILLSLGPNSNWENPESHAFDICITPGGNTFAQCTRQLILTMSSALGGRMKQRFDLIGCEKVSHLDPAGEEGGFRGMCFTHARTNAKSSDLSVRLLPFPVWVRLWVSRINTH